MSRRSVKLRREVAKYARIHGGDPDKMRGEYLAMRASGMHRRKSGIKRFVRSTVPCADHAYRPSR